MDLQHPVPQQISSYQFRLVGDMTLKQFLELAAGALMGLFVYASSIPALFKWPIIIIFVLFGAALAFLPIEDRPLEVWVIAFLKSIYNPTLYNWGGKASDAQYFQPEDGSPNTIPGVVAPHGEAALNQYLKEKPQSKIPFFAKLEETEKMFLSKVTGLFGGGAQLGSQASGQPGIGAAGQLGNSNTGQINTTPNQQINQSTIPNVMNIQMQNIPGGVINPASPTANFTIPSSDTGEFRVDGADNNLNTTPAAPVAPRGLSIPQVQPVSIKPADQQDISTAGQQGSQTINSSTTQQSDSQPIQAIAVAPAVAATNLSQNVAQAQFSESAAPPMPPTQPNTISGQVMDANGRIIDSVILEIKDAAGRPVRAVKTNKLGHFFIVTPMADGTYEILAEKDGYTFDPIQFAANGNMIAPMAIRAKAS